MKIREIYQLFCLLYDKNPIDNIEDYLVVSQNNENCRLIGNKIFGREALLLKETGDSLEMALFIAPEIVTTLEFGKCLDHADELSCATEGISHLFYVADRAAHDRKVSQLEIELQGEVDKFLFLHLLASEELKAVPPKYFIQQFENFSLDKNLNPEERERYGLASHFAAKYCSHLYDRYFNPLRRTELITEARGFFEKDLGEKLKRLIP